MASGELLCIMEQMRREEAVGKKEKPAFSVPNEKRLQYYSGWDKIFTSWLVLLPVTHLLML